MAEYQRFVAYVYEYQKGKKGSNCGFIKVEAWQKLCRIEIHLRCPGLIAGTECKVYGFVRKKGLLDGSRIGICRTGEGKLEGVLETQTMAVGTGKIPLGNVNGMVLIMDSGGFFGTEWDDQPIRPEDFREIPETVKPEETLEKNAQIKEVVVETEEPVQEEKDVEILQPEIHTQSVQESEIAECPQCPETPEAPHQPYVSDSGHSSESPHMPKRQPETLNKPIGTPCDPFNDGELTECRKISSEDLCLLGRRACMLRNNRFLQYGYYNFGHLLLCRDHCGQWILGVPGGYDQQERFMANMFGFSYFKESGTIRIPKGKGGYWYRLIDAPNFNQ